MKRSKQCPKCESLRIGYLANQPDANETAGGTIRAVAEKLKPVDAGFWWTPRTEGFLEAYVCTDCGYHESYVKSPQQLPWEKLEGFGWINPPPSKTGPFR